MSCESGHAQTEAEESDARRHKSRAVPRHASMPMPVNPLAGGTAAGRYGDVPAAHVTLPLRKRS